MLDRLEAIKARFDQLGVALTNPEIVGNNKKFAETSKEYRSLEKIVVASGEYKKVLEDIEFYTSRKNELNSLTETQLQELDIALKEADSNQVISFEDFRRELSEWKGQS